MDQKMEMTDLPSPRSREWVTEANGRTGFISAGKKAMPSSPVSEETASSDAAAAAAGRSSKGVGTGEFSAAGTEARLLRRVVGSRKGCLHGRRRFCHIGKSPWVAKSFLSRNKIAMKTFFVLIGALLLTAGTVLGQSAGQPKKLVILAGKPSHG